jgi:hypothetical protein
VLQASHSATPASSTDSAPHRVAPRPRHQPRPQPRRQQDDRHVHPGRHAHIDRAEDGELATRGKPAPLHQEARHHRHEEQDGFRVEHVGEEAGAEQPRIPARPFAPFRLAAPPLDGEPEQERYPRPAQHLVERRHARDQLAHAEGRDHRVHHQPSRHPGHRDQPEPPPPRQRDHRQRVHVRPRRELQDQHGEEEGLEIRHRPASSPDGPFI